MVCYHKEVGASTVPSTQGIEEVGGHRTLLLTKKEKLRHIYRTISCVLAKYLAKYVPTGTSDSWGEIDILRG